MQSVCYAILLNQQGDTLAFPSAQPVVVMVDQPQVQMRLSVDELAALDEVRAVLGARTYGIVPSRGELAKVATMDWIAARQREFTAPPREVPPPDQAAPEPAPAAAHRKLALAERVRAMRAAGVSYPRIVKQFTDEEIVTFSGKPGAKWSNSTIAHLERFRG